LVFASVLLATASTVLDIGEQYEIVVEEIRAHKDYLVSKALVGKSELARKMPKVFD